MKTFLTLTASASMLVLLVLGENAHGVDPSRTNPGISPVPNPADPFSNPAGTLPGYIAPSSTPVPYQPANPFAIDNRGRIDVGTTNGINYGGSVSGTPINYGVGSNGLPGLGSTQAISYPGVGPTDSRITPSLVNPQPSPQHSQPKRWRLGVYSKDTDAGVRVIQVVPGSAAQRAGLEANDVIVCVAGFQVGYIGSELYDCSSEFERHADADGWVTLLVQDNRTRSLANLPVQLDSRFKTISGSMSYRERYTLPRDAVAEIELREVLRAGAPPVTLARKVVTNISQMPIPFAIEFDPSQIDRNRTYYLTGTITSNGQTLFVSRESLPITPTANATNLQVTVESIQAATSSGDNYVSLDQQMTQLTKMFREYLGREPRSSELYVWHQHFARGGTVAQAQAELLGLNEYYNRADADDAQYIRQLYRDILNKQPTQQELTYWMQRMRDLNRLRPEVTREFLSQVVGPQT